MVYLKVRVKGGNTEKQDILHSLELRTSKQTLSLLETREQDLCYLYSALDCMNCGFAKHCSSFYPLQSYISVSPFHNSLFFLLAILKNWWETKCLWMTCWYALILWAAAEEIFWNSNGGKGTHTHTLYTPLNSRNPCRSPSSWGPG